jgi:rod shape-determining protein MreD
MAFSTGYLFDLLSGAPRGIHAFVFVITALIIRAAATRLAVRGIVLKAATAFVASLIAALLVVVLRAQISREVGYGGLSLAPVEALLTAVIAPPILWLLARVDGRLDRAQMRVGVSRRHSSVIGSRLPPH